MPVFRNSTALSVLVEARFALPASVGRPPGRNARDHEPAGRHAGDGHRVRVQRPGHVDRKRAAGRAAGQAHVGQIEPGHRLAELHVELDGRDVGRVGLADRLVDRHRRR